MGKSQAAILLTGATGYIGRRVLPLLLARGEAVICLVHRHDLPADCLQHPGCRVLSVDLAKPPPASILAGHRFDRVLHLAGLSRAAPQQMQALNDGGTAFLLDAACAVNVRHFAYVSSVDAASAVRTAYGDSKLAAENRVSQSGLPYSIVRPGLVYGHGDGALAYVAGFARRFHCYPLSGTGRQCWQPVFVDDLAACLVQCLSQPPLQGVLSVGGARAVEAREVFRQTLDHAGIRAWPVRLPDVLLRILEGLLLVHPVAQEMVRKLRLNARDRILLPGPGSAALPTAFPDGL